MDLQAINIRNRNNKRSFNTRAIDKTSFRSRTFNKPSVPTKNLNKSTKKYCRICDLAGIDVKVYTSHEIGQCNRLSFRDFESIRDAMVLNGMVTPTEEEDPSEQIIHQQGWDYEAAEEESSDE